MPEEFDPAWEYFSPDPDLGDEVIKWESDMRISQGHTCYPIPSHNDPTGNRKLLLDSHPELVRQMWDLGFTVQDIMDKFGILSRSCFTKVRNRLQLPPRPVGWHQTPRYLMTPDQNGKPLSEISGRAVRTPHLSLEDAQAMILQGVPICDVFPQVDSADHAMLREWFVRSAAVTDNRRASYRATQASKPADNPFSSAYPNGEFCKKCGGLLVQKGKCKGCVSCDYTDGGCS
jgi:hypothetical protein